jgi:UDP-glucuronate decarboxylase
MKIRWITPLLGTAPAMSVIGKSGLYLIDVRDLVDKAGNREEQVKEKILQGSESLRNGCKTIIGCDYGISRSNAIAAGVLAHFEGITLEAAVRKVLRATGETEIKLAPLQAVRNALGENKPIFSKNKRRVLVTGSTGFLGVPIVLQLSSEFEVIAPKRADLDLQQGGTKLDLIAGESEVDCIVHCASPRVYTSNIALGCTLTMLRNVLDVCTTRNIHLVYLSSWEIYSGYRSNCLYADEQLPPLPKGPYGETKYLCEILIEHARNTLGLRCGMLRSSPVYGAKGDKPKFIYNFIDKIRRSEPVMTHEYRNCKPALDLLYVDDLVAAVKQVVSAEFIGTLNVGTGVLTSTKSVAEMLMMLLGRQCKINSTQIDADIACIAMDSAKAGNTLGWRPGVCLEKGLLRIISSMDAP